MPGGENTTLVHLDPVMAAELQGTVFKDVENFVETLYPTPQQEVEDHLIANLFDREAGNWKEWPHEATENSVIAWFQLRLTPAVKNAAGNLFQSIPRFCGDKPLGKLESGTGR